MSERIFIVEDEPNMVKMLSMTLEASGYSIESAVEAETAYKQIKSSPPDLIILDVMLPKASGIELLKAIRQDPQISNLPVMILSALSSVEQKVVGIEAGADEYLTKPIEARELVARVSGLLQRTARLREAAAGKQGNIVSFIGVKGGVGTTTSVLHIAASLARKMSDLLVVELQPSFSTMVYHLGLKEQNHIGNLALDAPDRINVDAIQKAVTKLPLGFMLICSDPAPDPQLPLSDQAATAILEAARETAAVVFVDLPTSFDAPTQAALALSDYVVLVMEPTPVCLDAARVKLSAVRDAASTAAVYGCMMVNRSAIASSLTALEVEAELGISILGTVPQAADVLSSAYKRSNLLISEQPNHAAMGALTTIAGSITERLKISS